MPYSVFLIPPFSRVGLSEKEAVEKGYKVKVARLAAAAIPKAQVLEQPAGLLKAVIDEETGLILGAHLFCQESYEMINMIKLAMDAKVPYQVPVFSTRCAAIPSKVILFFNFILSLSNGSLEKVSATWYELFATSMN